MTIYIWQLPSDLILSTYFGTVTNSSNREQTEAKHEKSLVKVAGFHIPCKTWTRWATDMEGRSLLNIFWERFHCTALRTEIVLKSECRDYGHTTATPWNFRKRLNSFHFTQTVVRVEA